MEDTKDLSENETTVGSDDENKSAISADLIRGHINTIILRTLYERDKYGYEIIEEIEKKSHGQYSLKQPTLYSALKRLESQGYINAYWKTDEVTLGGRRKYYTLTDSGREITEKNQAEWEYSRTVIDNLISDRSFDFSQPAPTAVDFKILKKSTSRVPVIKDNDDDEDDEDEVIEEIKKEQPQDTADNEEAKGSKIITAIPEVEINPETVTFTEQVVYYASPAPAASSSQSANDTEASIASNQDDSGQIVNNVEKTVIDQPPVTNAPFTQNEPEAKHTEPVTHTDVKTVDAPMNEEQRRIVHENYLKLISEPIAPPPPEVDEVPIANKIDTDSLIYNNKPETERDYKNLIDSLYTRTVKRKQQVQTEVMTYTEPQPTTTKLEDINVKAENDGLRVNTSEYVVTTRKKSYNRGGTLFKSSLIVAIVLVLEFVLCLLFRKELNVGIAYPMVILAIAAAQLLIFGVIYYTDLGKTSRKPISATYLSACIIVTVIMIFIIFIVSLILGINFASTGEIFAKLIIPCLVALNIPVFATSFYAFSK